jgi:hypothetical protein
MFFPVSDFLTIDSVGNYSFPVFSYYGAILHDMLHQKDSSHLITIRYLSLDRNSIQGIAFSLHQTNFSSRSYSISSSWRQKSEAIAANNTSQILDQISTAQRI